MIVCCLVLGTDQEKAARDGEGCSNFPVMTGHRRGGYMTDRSRETVTDVDLRNLFRIVSACTLGLWAFAAGLLIGVFWFS